MILTQDKPYLIDRIQDTICSYPHDKSWHVDDDERKPLRPGYQGTVIDFSPYEWYEKYEFGTEMGFIWKRTIQGVKVFGNTVTGTRTPVQWMLNFAAMRDDEPEYDEAPYGYETPSGVWMHAGFKAGYDMLAPYLREKTEEAIRRDGITTIAGDAHSRGAAILQIWALDMSRRYADMQALIRPEDINITLVASPRVFNVAGQVSYDKRVPSTVAIINRNDPVAGVPSDGMGFSAVAQRRTYRIGHQWYDTVSPSNWLTWLCYRTDNLLLNGVGAAVSGKISGDDHHPMHYKKNMSTFQ